ncbi:MAG: gamma carbonic anhydrase family protein [Thermomicrobiales bacterium]|nr:gamma carbonic anhydrase family protein [Thermomicrobiales bacterium]
MRRPVIVPVDGRTPQIRESAFVAPGAVVTGDVTLADNSGIWFNAVLRGDVEPIRVGARSNVQDNAVLHTDPGFPCTIGEDVTIGHTAIVHGSTVGNGATIGMGATVLSGSEIGEGAVVAAGAVVTEGAKIGAGMIAAGVPARELRPVRADEQERFARGTARYVERAKTYAALFATEDFDGR